MFVELFGNVTLVRLFPLELLQKYFDPVFYSSFFLMAVITFRKAFFSAIRSFKANYEGYLMWVAIFLVIALVLMITSAIILDSFGVGESANQEAIDKSIAKYGIVHILTVCIFGPVVEEVFYRGILFEALKGKEGNTIRGVFAILLTSLLFAFAHVSVIGFTVDDLLANIPVFMLGLSITALYFKTDNIICSILLHIIINSYATLG
ncbi:MAG: CPBP family intramembrane glutamic endopeptidase [Acutalibacteraceae bacterium]|nr:CPBP family intramembrane glutamic endopeptidase [Acutalibacteraceae bacterium]